MRQASGSTSANRSSLGRDFGILETEKEPINKAGDVWNNPSAETVLVSWYSGVSRSVIILSCKPREQDSLALNWMFEEALAMVMST